MNKIDIYEHFCEFEKENDLMGNASYSYIWEGIRISVYDQLLRGLSNIGVAHDKVNIFRYLLSCQPFKTIGNILKSSFQLVLLRIGESKEKVKYLFVIGGRRKLETDGNYWDLYVDPIAECLSESDYLIIEASHQYHHLKPAKSKNLVYKDSLELQFRLFGVISKLQKEDREVATLYREINEKFKKEFNIDLGLVKRAQQYQKRYLYSEKVYERLLRRVAPQILFLVCGYGKESLIIAAKDLHIPVVEFQHGVLSKYHLGYDVSSGTKEDFADYFFSFGPAWGQMAHFPIPQEKIIPIGYQYLNTAVSKLKDINKKDQILFLSQGTIGDRLSDFAVNLLEYIPSNVSIVFKLHPGEYLRWKTEYKSLYDASQEGLISVIAGDSPSLYELMAESKWQIGVNSTALFEGMAFKCKTYIVDLPGIEYVETLIDNNEFILVQKPEQIEFTYNPNELNYRTEEYFSQDTETKFKAAVDFVMKDYYA
jgi:hypothetical protein